MAKLMIGIGKKKGGARPVVAALAPDDSGADPSAAGGPPDLSAVGNAASASKSDTGAGANLQEFTVKQGDDGGVVVCETNVATPPSGRRYGASFPQQGTYTETPYSPDDSQAAMDHVTDLMSQLGVAPSDSGDDATNPSDQGDTSGDAMTAAAPGPGPMPAGGDQGTAGY